jgi:hypothetical protein
MTPVLTEVLLQAVGDPEDPAELADVLAHQQNLVVVLHRLAQPGVEALGEGDLSERSCRLLAEGRIIGIGLRAPSKESRYAAKLVALGSQLSVISA